MSEQEDWWCEVCHAHVHHTIARKLHDNSYSHAIALAAGQMADMWQRILKILWSREVTVNDEVRRLIETGLAGNPPESVARDLRDLRDGKLGKEQEQA